MKPPGLLILISLIFFTSCATRVAPRLKEFTFTITYPAKNPLKPDTNTIVIINSVNLDKEDNLNKRQLKAEKSGAYATIKYAADQLVNLPHTRVINLVDRASMATNYYTVEAIAAKYHSDYILALTTYQAYVTDDTDSDDGSISFYKNIDVTFTLFLGDGRLYKHLEAGTTDLAGSSVHGQILASLLEPTIAGNKKHLIEASQVATYNALYDYLPYKQTISRPLYQDAQLKPMVTEMVAGRYKKAYDVVQPLLKDDDPAIAYKAAYNLAVLYEIQRDRNKAIDMAQTSLDKKDNPYAADLLNDLKTESKLSP